MVQLSWPTAEAAAIEDAILLEIWDQGAKLQTSSPIPDGTRVKIQAARKSIDAEVFSQQRDHNFGFLIDLEIHSPAWRNYSPAWTNDALAR